MSQDNWGKLDQLLTEKLAKMKAELAQDFKTESELFRKNLTTQPANGSFSEKHKSIEEQLDCPDCYKKIKDAVLAKEKKPKKDYFCLDCGQDVDLNEAECPTCHGKQAKQRKK